MSRPYASLEELRGLIGEPRARRLVAAFGGRSIYLPRSSRATERGALAKVIGVAAARRLAERWMNEHVMIPLGAAQRRRERNRRVLRDAARMSQSEIARRYQLHLRTVERILHRERRAGSAQ